MPRRTFVNPGFGSRLRELREERGMSLRAVGREVPCSHVHVLQLEKGRAAPSTAIVARLDSVLNAGGGLKQLVVEAELAAPTPESLHCSSGTAMVRAQHAKHSGETPPTMPSPSDPQNQLVTLLLGQLEDRRQQVLDAVSVGTVTRAGIEEWERTVLRHGRATRYRPALQMLMDLEGDLADLQRALAGHHRSSTLRVLTRVAAQMAGLVFLSLIKLNRAVSARVWARTARVAADEARDPATRCWVRAQEAYVYYYDGYLAEAVEVARHARELAGRAAVVGIPLAAALEARALALLGRRREALSALDTAESALGRMGNDAITPSAFGYNEAQLRFHEGNALTHLRATAAAQASQQRALDLYPPEDFLDRALIHLDQTQCLAHDGDVNAAAERAIRAVADLTDQQRAGLITVRANELLTVLTRQHAAAPGVHELRDLLAQGTERERTTL